MSWSNRWIGKPKAIIAALDAFEASQTGNNRAEFQKAKPALVTLLESNDDENVVDLDANGHVYRDTATCQVTLKKIGRLCE